jgi:uncharacterized protein YndB with AHSA1/START domain
MTKSDETVSVRVTHRFDASAERVYDAFLDPGKASRFMFMTATGQIVRCEIDGRVGGAFVIVDRRDGEDVAHRGTFLELERPRRIVFTLSVEKYSSESNKVTIQIAPLGKGCELTLTHEMRPPKADVRERTREGWTAILEAAAELLVDEAPTCGIGVAQHATIPLKIGTMFEGLAETLELHRKMLVQGDANSKKEDEVYRELAASFREIAKLVTATATRMKAAHDLPMGAHDEAAWSDEHLRAFEKFTRAQSEVLAMVRIAAERDEKMLASMKKGG